MNLQADEKELKELEKTVESDKKRVEVLKDKLADAQKRAAIERQNFINEGCTELANYKWSCPVK